MVCQVHFPSFLFKHSVLSFCLAKYRYGFDLSWIIRLAVHVILQLIPRSNVGSKQFPRLTHKHILQHKDLCTEVLTLHMGTYRVQGYLQPHMFHGSCRYLKKNYPDRCVFGDICAFVVDAKKPYEKMKLVSLTQSSVVYLFFSVVTKCWPLESSV